MSELECLVEAVDMLRKRVRKDMPSQHIALLLAVAQSPGISMPELGGRLEMPQGTLSRNVKALSSYVDRSERLARVKGLDLLYTEQSRSNPHALAVYLTEKGKALVAELVAVMEAADDQSGDYPASQL